MSGLEVSRRDFLEGQQVEFLFGDQPFQLRVLVAQLAEFLGFVDVHCPVTVTSVVERRRGDAELSGDFLARRAVSGELVRGAEFANDLFR